MGGGELGGIKPPISPLTTSSSLSGWSLPLSRSPRLMIIHDEICDSRVQLKLKIFVFLTYKFKRKYKKKQEIFETTTWFYSFFPSTFSQFSQSCCCFSSTIDCPQSLSYFVPQESHSQAGLSNLHFTASLLLLGPIHRPCNLGAFEFTICYSLLPLYYK